MQHDAHVQALMDEIEGEYSDAHKDLYGVRARMSFWRGEEISVATMQAKLDRLYDSLRSELEREQREQAEFEAKVAALGLDPARHAKRQDPWEQDDHRSWGEVFADATGLVEDRSRGR